KTQPDLFSEPGTRGPASDCPLLSDGSQARVDRSADMPPQVCAARAFLVDRGRGRVHDRRTAATAELVGSACPTRSLHGGLGVFPRPGPVFIFALVLLLAPGPVLKPSPARSSA